MGKKKYVLRLEENVDAYIQRKELKKGINPINMIRGIIADRKWQDKK